MILMLMKYQSLKKKHGKYNSFKYFIAYNDNDVIRPLYLFISRTTGYINKLKKKQWLLWLKIYNFQKITKKYG